MFFLFPNFPDQIFSLKCLNIYKFFIQRTCRNRCILCFLKCRTDVRSHPPKYEYLKAQRPSHFPNTSNNVRGRTASARRGKSRLKDVFRGKATTGNSPEQIQKYLRQINARINSI